jgi:lysophospholipase L1-like esterase
MTTHGVRLFSRFCLGLNLLGVCLGARLAVAQVAPPVSLDALAEKYKPAPAPPPAGLLLQKGDRLAICGDSITEQKMYSRIMETYLTVCVPELKVTVRQYGWGGETAGGFLARMTNDCLRFKPTIATTCYGMNDHRYRAYEDSIGEAYRQNQTAIVRAFKAHGARVVLGSPGCVSKRPEALNLSLCRLRNICIEIAQQEQVGFADVFWPMFTAGEVAKQRWGSDYMIAGKDTIHPGWAGHLIMAYAFLKALGLDGDIGTFTVDLERGSATVSPGHELVSYRDGELRVRSYRYPFCATGEVSSDNSLRSGMALVPFNRELNRLLLVVKNPSAARYRVSWGDQSKSFAADALRRGVNLAEEFEVNPFSEAFTAVDRAVAAKQEYETRQIKVLFHGPEFRADPEAVVSLTERVRAPLVEAIGKAFVPVTHTIRLSPE